MRYTLTRDMQLPAGAVKIADKDSDAVAYIYAATNGKPAAMLFIGKSNKPTWRHLFQTEVQREAKIKFSFEASRQRQKQIVADRKARKSAVASVKFEVGETYCDRSSCDWDTIYSFKVLERTAKTLTLEYHGERRKRGVYVYNGVEKCKPHGTYSMCAVISADRKGRP